MVWRVKGGVFSADEGLALNFRGVWSFVDKGGRGKSVLEEKMLWRFLMELAV